MQGSLRRKLRYLKSFKYILQVFPYSSKRVELHFIPYASYYIVLVNSLQNNSHSFLCNGLPLDHHITYTSSPPTPPLCIIFLQLLPQNYFRVSHRISQANMQLGRVRKLNFFSGSNQFTSNLCSDPKIINQLLRFRYHYTLFFFIRNLTTGDDLKSFFTFC